jgi:hypothetical protein
MKEVKEKNMNRKLEMVKLIQRKNDYGNKAEKEMKNIRVKTESHVESQREKESRVFWDKIKLEN